MIIFGWFHYGLKLWIFDQKFFSCNINLFLAVFDQNHQFFEVFNKINDKSHKKPYCFGEPK
jgi:hypothetical protein